LRQTVEVEAVGKTRLWREAKRRAMVAQVRAGASMRAVARKHEVSLELFLG
jgi:hypothetical protein